MTDQQRYDTFSFNNPAYITPHMDALIKDSVFFENAFCTNPSCVPSRAAIMTGKYPSECGAPSFITPLPETETTFMKRLQEAGYYTSVIGKQHFAGSKIDQGYDEANIIDCHFASDSNEEAEAFVGFLNEQGLSSEDVMNWDLISGGTWQVDTAFHLDYYIGELGKKWLATRPNELEEQPWFFTLSFPGPHHPYDLEGTKYSELYDIDQIKTSETTYEDLDQKPPHFKEMSNYAKIYLKDFTEEQFRKSKRAYMANMTLIDEKVGEIIQSLNCSGRF